jgi:glycosyltransferase involved in cell wall biosynthesis
VITEAMSHARAVIGSNRGPTAWLVDDKKTGLLFDPLVEGDLAEKILLLAGNKELAQTYGLAGLEKVNTFLNNEDIIDKSLVIYSAVAQGI